MNRENIICPGETIKELLETYNYTQNDLSKKLNMELKTTNQILNGEAPITTETALKLEMIFDIDASFWINLEFNYRRKLKEFNEIEKNEKEYDIVKNIYKEMSNRNLVEKTRDKLKVVTNFKKFMEIIEINDLEKEYNKVFCRKANVSYFNYINLLVWIQIGIKKARDVEIKEYNKKLVYENINNIRELTKMQDQEEARNRLIKICNNCGIILLFEKSLPNSAIYGIAKWLTPNKPFIQISDRGKNLSTFWFTFMHELGHIVEGRKKKFFIDCDEELKNDSDVDKDEKIINQVEELKADKFSNNHLIPAKDLSEFLEKKDFSNKSIIDFANKISIAPYIVAGRLKYELNEYNNSVLNSFTIKNEF